MTADVSGWELLCPTGSELSSALVERTFRPTLSPSLSLFLLSAAGLSVCVVASYAAVSPETAVCCNGKK